MSYEVKKIHEISCGVVMTINRFDCMVNGRLYMAGTLLLTGICCEPKYNCLYVDITYASRDNGFKIGGQQPYHSSNFLEMTESIKKIDKVVLKESV